MKELVRPRLENGYLHVAELYAIMVGNKKLNNAILSKIPKSLVRKYIVKNIDFGHGNYSWGIDVDDVELFLIDLNEKRMQTRMSYIQEALYCWKQNKTYDFEDYISLPDGNNEQVKKCKHISLERYYENNEDIMFLIRFNEQNVIRATPDKKFSVYDTIKCVSKELDPRSEWLIIQNKFPDIMKKWDVSYYQFPGEKQSKIPVINQSGLIPLINVIDGDQAGIFRLRQIRILQCLLEGKTNFDDDIEVKQQRIEILKLEIQMEDLNSKKRRLEQSLENTKKQKQEKEIRRFWGF